MNSLKEFLEKSIELGDNNISMLSFFLFLVTLVLTWVLARIAKKILSAAVSKRNVEPGKRHAVLQIAKYIIYFTGIVIALQVLGLPLQSLILGSAALLVGVGIGLQQLFFDLMSGFILLFDRKVEVNDIVDIDGVVGKVDHIGLRTSTVRTLDNISIIIPNSKLISENVINWSANHGLARFTVPVSVAYGSDVQKVKELLIQCANGHELVLGKPAPTVWFTDFGQHGLAFQLFFWSKHFLQTEKVKSDIRFAIDDAFREAGVTIPFPQVDVHFDKDIQTTATFTKEESRQI